MYISGEMVVKRAGGMGVFVKGRLEREDYRYALRQHKQSHLAEALFGGGASSQMSWAPCWGVEGIPGALVSGGPFR